MLSEEDDIQEDLEVDERPVLTRETRNGLDAPSYCGGGRMTCKYVDFLMFSEDGWWCCGWVGELIGIGRMEFVIVFVMEVENPPLSRIIFGRLIKMRCITQDLVISWLRMTSLSG